MKICAIGLRGIPNVMGGIESHCQQLYPRLVKRGAEVTVLARSPYVGESKSMFEGVEVIPVWAIRNKFLETILHTFVAIIYARIFVHPDVLHIHAIGPALWTPFARLLGMKVVVTHHGADYDRHKWSNFAKNLLRLGESLGVRFANKVCVVGKSLSSNMRESFPKHQKKIIFIPNGAIADFNLNVVEDDLLATDLPIEKYNYILTVGRLVPEKGFHDLVEAFKKSNSTSKLVVVGDADHQDEYASNLVNNSSQNIIFAGRREGKYLKALYKYARLFVLPSYHEGLPIVALEAISADTPVLLSNIVPNLDIGLSSDHYFEVGNQDELASKLKLEIGKVPQYKILRTYDWDLIATKTFQVMASLTDSAPTSKRESMQ